MSNSGESLPICWRLRREGVDAKIYIHSRQYRKPHNGLVPKLTIKGLKKEIKLADVIIFDMTHPNEKTKEDQILLKIFGLKASVPSVFGPIADKLKKDHKVIGASALTEQIELNRAKGAKLAEKMGFALPESHRFKTLKEGAGFLKGRKDLWVFKPSGNQDLDMTYVEKFPGELASKLLNEYAQRLEKPCEFILQKKINGTEVSTEVWIGQQGPMHFNHTIESKRLMDANLGPAIGSQSNTVWIEKNENGLLTEPLARMAAYLHKEGYIGPCDANCIVAAGKPYFLEWTPRFGYDAIFCLLTLLKSSLSDFFGRDFKADFFDGYAASQRLSIPPYPYASPQLRTKFAKDTLILGKPEKYPFAWLQDVYLDGRQLKCAGADGILGIVVGRGAQLEEAWGRVYNALGKIKVCSYLQYRMDGYKDAKERIRSLKIA